MRLLKPRAGKATHTVLATISRAYPLARFFDSIAASDIPFADCRFIAYCDTDSDDLIAEVKSRALAVPFAAVTLAVTGNAPFHASSPTEHFEVAQRHGRSRQETVALVPKATDRLLLLEDDTTVPPDSWQKLSAMLESGYDWAIGFEVSRWQRPCAGIWRIQDGTISSMMPQFDLDTESYVQDIDASGLYLVMTTPAVYAAQRWDTYDHTYGQDVSVTYALSQSGYRLGVDWSLECVHIGPDRDWTCGQVVEFVRAARPHQPEHVDDMVKPAQSVVRGRTVTPLRNKRLVMGKTVEMDGVVYERGQRVDLATAIEMSNRNLISARF